MLIKDIGNGYCQYSWLCFLKKQLSEALHRRREICILYWKLGILSKHYLALPKTGIQISRFFSLFFLSVFYCNIFLRRMHTYKCFLKRMASPLQCLANRHELEGRIGAGWQAAACKAKHPNSSPLSPLSCVCHSGCLCLPFWGEFPALEHYCGAEMAKAKCRCLCWNVSSVLSANTKGEELPVLGKEGLGCVCIGTDFAPCAELIQ